MKIGDIVVGREYMVSHEAIGLRPARVLEKGLPYGSGQRRIGVRVCWIDRVPRPYPLPVNVRGSAYYSDRYDEREREVVVNAVSVRRLWSEWEFELDAEAAIRDAVASGRLVVTATGPHDRILHFAGCAGIEEAQVSKDRIWWRGMTEPCVECHQAMSTTSKLMADDAERFLAQPPGQ